MKITDEMVEVALRQHYGGNKWHDDYRRQMRATLEAALAAAPSKVLPSDTRLWHIISRHQRDAGLKETVPLNRAMYRACMEAMLDVDVAAAPQAEPVVWILRYQDAIGEGRACTNVDREVAESFDGAVAEPVAWRYKVDHSSHWHVSVHSPAKVGEWNVIEEAQPLYTAPPAPAAPQWIACEERLPEAGVEVLVWLAAPVIKYGCQIAIDTWDEQHEAPVAWSSATIPIGEGWDSGADWQDITHWMPLPAAPRSER